MSAIASSSRVLLRAPVARVAAGPSHIRTVVHHARPPRIPVLHSPHNPKQPLPTSGTSHANPRASPGSAAAAAAAAQSGVRLDGSGLTLHYAPPPSAPSYTTGAVPPLLRWVNGERVPLTGEEAAPLRVPRKEGAGVGTTQAPAWDGQVKKQMREMRQRGMSRLEIAQSLAIPTALLQHIARAAPLSPEQNASIYAKRQETESAWGYRKRVARAAREKRRTYW